MQIEINNAICEGNIDAAKKIIASYFSKNPYDYDLFSCNIACLLAEGRVEEANQVAIQAYHENGYDVENLYNLALTYEEVKNNLKALEFYCRTLIVENIQKKFVISEKNLNNEINRVNSLILETINMNTNENNELLEKYKKLRNDMDDKFHYGNTEFHGMTKNTVGKFYLSPNEQWYYIGAYKNFDYSYFDNDMEVDFNNTIGEFFPVDNITNTYSWKEENDVIIPVMPQPDRDKAFHCIDLVLPDRLYERMIYVGYNHFAYYRCPKEGKLVSNDKLIVGKPISTKHDDKKKKLVLSIFVDSLTWQFIKEENFEKIMPYTKHFFEKGVICKNMYAGSEFTYPSIATYVTGLEPQNHMFLNSDIKSALPEEQEILFETFKNDGYVTGKIGGNDGVVPTFGYLRGIDRCLYKYSSNNYGVVETVADVIDHIQTFKDCNQFIWMENVDLHDVAGEFPRTIDVETQLLPQYHCQDNQWVSTVKQDFSYNKCQILAQEAKHFDLYMNTLYNFLEQNYTDDEMVVTLFSDHGTGFGVENDKMFMSKNRTNVPLMIRGSVSAGECTEFIQSTDYAKILCKIAGVNRDVEDDSNLPVYFGGEHERQFVLSQSIFPGDTYKAVIQDKDGSFELESAETVDFDCRFTLKDCAMKLLDQNDQKYEDCQKEEKYFELVADKVKKLLIYD